MYLVPQSIDYREGDGEAKAENPGKYHMGLPSIKIWIAADVTQSDSAEHDLERERADAAKV